MERDNDREERERRERERGKEIKDRIREIERDTRYNIDAFA